MADHHFLTRQPEQRIISNSTPFLHSPNSGTHQQKTQNERTVAIYTFLSLDYCGKPTRQKVIRELSQAGA
jgi:hypothetical protein